MAQLQLVRDIGPAGAFVAAGFVRNRVWDALYEHNVPYPEADIDVVFFCRGDSSKDRDMAVEAALHQADPSSDWQVRNQARMHDFGGHKPFTSLDHALTHWAETATSVSVRLDAADQLHFIAPMGFEDLERHILRITPVMKACDPKGFDKRLAAKGWLERWPNLTVVR